MDGIFLLKVILVCAVLFAFEFYLAVRLIRHIQNHRKFFDVGDEVKIGTEMFFAVVLLDVFVLMIVGMRNTSLGVAFFWAADIAGLFLGYGFAVYAFFFFGRRRILKELQNRERDSDDAFARRRLGEGDKLRWAFTMVLATLCLSLVFRFFWSSRPMSEDIWVIAYIVFFLMALFAMPFMQIVCESFLRKRIQPFSKDTGGEA